MKTKNKHTQNMLLGRKKGSKNSHQSREDDSHHSSSNENLSLRDSKESIERMKNMYEVHFLGIVPDLLMTNSLSRDKEAQLVDRIEEAQIEGKLPIAAQEDGRMKINISIHGIKCIDMNGLEILQRHPLHTIAQVVQYNDGGDTNYIVLKIGQVNKPHFSAYVFQCSSEEQAQSICQSVRAMFDKVTGNDKKT